MFKFSSLQPHNILLASKENSAPIKIADFGIATEIGEEGYVTSGKKNWMKLLLLAEVQLHIIMVFTNIAEGKSCSDYEFSRSSILLQDHLLGNSSAKMFLKN